MVEEAFRVLDKPVLVYRPNNDPTFWLYVMTLHTDSVIEFDLNRIVIQHTGQAQYNGDGHKDAQRDQHNMKNGGECFQGCSYLAGHQGLELVWDPSRRSSDMPMYRHRSVRGSMRPYKYMTGVVVSVMAFRPPLCANARDGELPYYGCHPPDP